jgi:5-formyltetrahydrofolate cyclo-ligase
MPPVPKNTMSKSIPELKAEMRAKVRDELQHLTRSQREDAAIEICARLIEQPAWSNARSVLLFAPLADEPNVRPLFHSALAAGKLTALPRFNAALDDYEAAIIRDLDRDCVEGKFGILEPAVTCETVDLKRLDLILVPGVAFGWQGHRLGRGKGFYDRLLVEVSGKTCGVGFDQQIVASIPVAPHDVRLNCILTPSHWLEF